VEYLWQPRGSYFYLLREIARLRRARGRPEKYTPVISLYLQPIRSLPPRGIRPFLFGETVARRRAFSHRRPCERAVFRSTLSRRSLAARGKNAGASFTARRSPFIFALRESARVFERRQRDMLMPIGAVKSWATAESRISIKAIEKDTGGWPLSLPPPVAAFVILLFSVQLGPGHGENAARTRIPAADKTGIVLASALDEVESRPNAN